MAALAQYAQIEWTRVSEDPSLKWARHKDIAVDSAGNVLSLSFISTSYSVVALHVNKITPAGALAWSYQTPTFAFDTDAEEMGIRCDASNNVIVVAQKEDRFHAIKLSPAGSVLWSVKWPDTTTSADDWEVRAFTLDASGNVYIAGEVTIGYSAFPKVGVMKLDAATGNVAWQALHGTGSEKLRAQSIALSSSGHLCVAARRSSSNTADIRLVSFSTSTGAERWSATYNSSFNQGDEPRSLAVTSSGDYVVGGVSANAQNYDAFVARYGGSDGAQIWVSRFNNIANSDDSVIKVLVDAQDNVFAAGNTQTPYVSGYLSQDDYLVTKHDGASGAVIWRKQYQGPCNGDSNDDAADACLDAAGNVIVTGGSTVGHTDSFTWALKSADGGRLWQQRYTRPDYYYDLAGFRVATTPDGRCMIAITTDKEELAIVRCNPASTVGTVADDTSAVQFVMGYVPPDGLPSTAHFEYKYLNPLTHKNVAGSTPNQAVPAATVQQTLSYFLTGVSPGTGVQFQLVIKNSSGTFYLPGNSYPFVFTYPMAPPSVDSGLLPQLVAAGEPVTFSATVSGGQPLSLQWRKNGANLPAPAGVSISYGIASAKTTDAGRYSLRASNLRGADLSNDGLLGVVNTVLPAVQAAKGGTIILSAVAAAPSGIPLTYQWNYNGSPLLNGTNGSGGVVAGATTAKLSITKATDAEEGLYTCTVSMAGLSLTTGASNVHVVDKPVVTVVPVPDAIVSGAFTWQLAGSEYPLGFTVTGLPSGLVYNGATGVVSGVPNVSGAFTLKISARNAAGLSAVVPFVLNIAALPEGTVGSFSAYLSRRARINDSLGGFLTLSVTSKGTFTGTLKNGTASYPLSGRLNAPVTGSPVASLPVKRTGSQLPLALDLVFDGAGNAVNGTLDDPGIADYDAAQVKGRRLTWSRTAARDYAAAYNCAVDLPEASLNDNAQPLGVGWQQMTVTAAGGVTGSGRTAEGAAFSFSGSLWPEGSLPQFVLIHAGRGSVMGLPRITTGANVPDNRVTGWVDEIKNGPASVTDRTYAAGIPYMERTIDGAPWIKPSPALPIVLGRADMAGNASIAFTKGGIEAAAQFSPTNYLAQTFRINKNNTTAFAAAGAGNPCALVMSIKTSTGLFSGSFTLKDTVSGKVVPRTVNYSGILLSHRNKGCGCFNLPGLAPSTAASPILSGRVVVN